MYRRLSILAAVFALFFYSAPAASAQTGANGRIAFTRVAFSASGPDIITINPDGSQPLNLTPYLGSVTRDTSPAWSPDGARIAFISDRDGNSELYTMDANGNDIRRLTTTAEIQEADPAWSPDGRQIAFVRIARTSSEASNIFVINASGGEARRLTNGFRDANPAWSPDGSRIAFSSSGEATNQRLYVVNADGTNQRTLGEPLGVNNVDPAWSPDGTRILFTHSQICVLPCSSLGIVNANGSGARNLSGGSLPGYVVNPAWSPDGARIVFAGTSAFFGGNTPGIYTATPEGGDVRRITNDPPNIEVTDLLPSWGKLPAPSAAGDIRFDFVNAILEVPENARSATITVRRSGGSDSRGELSREVSVKYLASDGRLFGAGCIYTADVGTAMPGVDYIEARGELVFAPGEEVKTFTVQIIDDAEREIRFRNMDGTPVGRQYETVFLTLDYSQYASANTEQCYGAGGILRIVDDEPSTAAAEVRAWTENGRAYGYARLQLPDGRFFLVDRGQVTREGDEFTVTAAIGRQPLTGAPVPVSTAIIYDLGALPAGVYGFTFRTTETAARRVQIEVGGARQPNPIDEAASFVRGHYVDFLSRSPDAPGLEFWTSQITRCGADASCTDRQRESVSASFFLSQEFQATGYYVYRLYRASSGRAPYYAECIIDAARVGAGIVVDNRLSPAIINSNKQAFARSFVARADFRSRYGSASSAEFVDLLFQTTGVQPTPAERQALVDELNSTTGTLDERRASVLYKIADGIRAVPPADGGVGVDQVFETRYGKEFYDAHFNRAFVLMEYFGYLRRDPDGQGYQFWLDKLNRFGDYRAAEMVRAFIVSAEYRSRFGQP